MFAKICLTILFLGCGTVAVRLFYDTIVVSHSGKVIMGRIVELDEQCDQDGCTETPIIEYRVREGEPPVRLTATRGWATGELKVEGELPLLIARTSPGDTPIVVIDSVIDMWIVPLLLLMGSLGSGFALAVKVSGKSEDGVGAVEDTVRESEKELALDWISIDAKANVVRVKSNAEGTPEYVFTKGSLGGVYLEKGVLLAVEHSQLRELRRSSNQDELAAAKQVLETAFEPSVRAGNLYGKSEVPAKARVWFGLEPLTKAYFSSQGLTFEVASGREVNGSTFALAKLETEEVARILVSSFGEEAYRDIVASAKSL